MTGICDLFRVVCKVLPVYDLHDYARRRPRVYLLPLVVALIWACTGLSVDVSLPRLGTNLWRMGWLDITANIVLYVPLGIALRRSRFLVCVAAALILSLCVETVQLFYPDRFTALSDVVANVAGATLGYAATRLFGGNSAGGLDPFDLGAGVGIFSVTLFFVFMVVLAIPGRPSDFSTWDRECQLIVGDELTRDRPWKGTIDRLMIFDSCFGADTIERVAQDGEVGGHAIFIAQAPMPMDSIRGLPLLDESAKDAFFDTLSARRTLTILVWFKTETNDQGGPARIVGFSKSPWDQNFSLGQEQRELIFRLRTPTTTAGGYNPQTKSRDLLEPNKRTFVAVTFDSRNTRVYVDGRQESRLNLCAHGRLSSFLSDSGLPAAATLLGAALAIGILGLSGCGMVWRRWLIGGAAGLAASVLFIAAGGVGALPELIPLVPLFGIFGGVSAAAATG